MPRSSTKYIVIHCAATRKNMDVGAKEIRQWHRARGWSDIGYHYVIRRNGKIERGRAEDAIGAHVEGHNSTSLGVCMVGGLGEGKGWPPENNFTPVQWAALQQLVSGLVRKYPGASVIGHRDFPGVNKSCPSFDARSWARDVGLPAAPDLRNVASGTRYGIASAGSYGAGDAAQYGANALDGNSDVIGHLIGVGQEKLSEAAQYLSIASTALKVLAVAASLYAAYKLARAAWRWYRGEQDGGQAESPEAEIAAESDIPALHAFTGSAPKRKRAVKRRPSKRRARR